jgi:DHA1 family inner membrane transport protein
MQMRVVNEAADAPNLASTINQGAFNLGNATGAWIGEIVLTAGLPYAQLPWIGAGIAAAALALTVVSYRLDVRASVPAPVYVKR